MSLSYPAKTTEAMSQFTGEEWRDVASVAMMMLVLPGRCDMSNDQGRVRFFSKNIMVFEISSNVRSPMILTKGLWSVMTTRFGQPMSKIFRLFKCPGNNQVTSPSWNCFSNVYSKCKCRFYGQVWNYFSWRAGTAICFIHCGWLNAPAFRTRLAEL